MPDSAGAGQHRGGFGAIYTISVISDVIVTMTPDRCRTGAIGAQGGGAGMPAYGWYIPYFSLERHNDVRQLAGLEPLFGMLDADGRPDPAHGEYCLGARYQTGKFSQLVVKAGDTLRVVIGGGGGWGDPLARDLDALERDIRDGLYSPDFAA